MFYSHEILTSREGGVATVWLVATLGSRSNLKRVNRKAILDVDVPKTCEIIITPEVPMALRLQSNLLYGVSRVYFQQCTYILSDAQTAHSNMRTLLKTMRTAELDPNAGKARPDQIILQDDPGFLPDFFLPGLDIDLSALDISTDEYSRRSSILSPHSQPSSQSSNKDRDESLLGLIIPTSDVGGAGEIGGFALPSDDRTSIQRSAGIGGFVDDEEEGFNVDPGFTVDEDGNLILTGDKRSPQRQAITETPFMRIGSDSAASGLARQEFEAGLEAGQREFQEALGLNLDPDLPIFDDGNNFLPDAEAFPEMVPQIPSATGHLQSSSAVREDESSSESAEAPLRPNRRAPKTLPYDNAPELRNANLTDWNNGYKANMVNETKVRIQHRGPKLSRQNATFWVGGSGIGSFGSGFEISRLQNRLNMFAGDALMEALTGVPASMAGKKRTRDDEGVRVSDSEDRRVRMRNDDGDQLGRVDDMPVNDEENFAILAEDDIEMGRDAQAALEDQSFPWNVSGSAVGSRPGSVARGFGFPSSAAGFSASGGRQSSAIAGRAGPPSSLDRRTSRIASASPLLGRGLARYSSLDLPSHEDDEQLLGGQDVSNPKELDDFQLFGPAAGVSTQTAAESQWIRATLDHESNNFLEFVKAEIAVRMPGVEEDQESTRIRKTVLFEELLPPLRHTKIVAAQALHHVLALATKGLINVEQVQDYGPIALGLSTGV